MESDRTPTTAQAPDAAEARRVLHELRTDRSALADRAGAPRWHVPAVAVAACVLVASPLIAADDTRTSVMAFVAIACGVISSLGTRDARVRQRGLLGWSVLVAAVGLVAVLALLTSAFVLVTFDLRGVVALPVAATFVLVLVGGRAMERIAHRSIVRG